MWEFDFTFNSQFWNSRNDQVLTNWEPMIAGNSPAYSMPCTTRPRKPADCAVDSQLWIGLVSPHSFTYADTSVAVKQRSIPNLSPWASPVVAATTSFRFSSDLTTSRDTEDKNLLPALHRMLSVTINNSSSLFEFFTPKQFHPSLQLQNSLKDVLIMSAGPPCTSSSGTNSKRPRKKLGFNNNTLDTDKAGVAAD